MEIKPASTRMEGLIALFDYQTTFFDRALEGIADPDMYKRLDTPANHMAWLAGAMVAQRYMMIRETKPGMKQTGAELFANNKGIQEEAAYPSIADYKKDWKTVSPFAREALVAIDDIKLDSDFEMGGMKMTWFDLISFTVYREASLIGQLALWRRLLGYPALKYD